MIDPKDLPLFARWVKSMGRAAADDPAAFAQIVAMSELLELELREATLKLQAQGYSWASIAAELGVRTQSAWERWHPRRS